MPTAIAHQAPHVDAAAANSAFLRLPRVRLTGLGRSTTYRMMKERQCAAAFRLAARAVAWRQTEIEQWSTEQPQLKV